MTADHEPRADAHIHLFAHGYQGRYGRSPAGGDELAIYESFRPVHHIVKALVVGYEGQPTYKGNNQYLSSLTETHPWIVPLAYLPVTPPPDTQLLRQLWADGFWGLSVYLPDVPSATAWSHWPAAVWAELNTRKALISLNCVASAAALVAEPAAQLTETSILLSHLGLPGPAHTRPTLGEARERLESVLRLSRYPQVVIKLSGLYAISRPAHAYPHHAAAPITEVIVENFTAERLCWGSDFSPCLDSVSFAQAVDLPLLETLSDHERAQVMGGNLLRLIDTVPDLRERES